MKLVSVVLYDYNEFWGSVELRTCETLEHRPIHGLDLSNGAPEEHHITLGDRDRSNDLMRALSVHD